MVKGLLFGLQRQEVRHLAIHAGGPQGTPEGDDQRPAVVHAQLPLGLLSGELKEVPPHRRAGDHHLLRVPVVPAAGLKAHQNPVGVGLQHLRGQPRHHVGLVDYRWNPGLGGGFHHGIAGVAAGADHRVRRKLPQNCPGLPGGPQKVADRDQIVPDLPGLKGAVKAGDVDGAEVVPRLGDQLLLQPPLRSHKEELRLRVLIAHQLRQRNSRVHMPCRSPAGKDDPFQILRQGSHPLSKTAFPHPAPAGRLMGPEMGHGPLRNLSPPWWVSSAWRQTAQRPSPPAEPSAPCRRS